MKKDRKGLPGFNGLTPREWTQLSSGSVNYGRGVGYEINEFVPPKDVSSISATEIRKSLKRE